MGLGVGQVHLRVAVRLAWVVVGHRAERPWLGSGLGAEMGLGLGLGLGLGFGSGLRLARAGVRVSIRPSAP